MRFHSSCIDGCRNCSKLKTKNGNVGRRPNVDTKKCDLVKKCL